MATLESERSGTEAALGSAARRLRDLQEECAALRTRAHEHHAHALQLQASLAEAQVCTCYCATSRRSAPHCANAAAQSRRGAGMYCQQKRPLGQAQSYHQHP